MCARHCYFCLSEQLRHGAILLLFNYDKIHRKHILLVCYCKLSSGELTMSVLISDFGFLSDSGRILTNLRWRINTNNIFAWNWRTLRIFLGCSLAETIHQEDVPVQLSCSTIKSKSSFKFTVPTYSWGHIKANSTIYLEESIISRQKIHFAPEITEERWKSSCIHLKQITLETALVTLFWIRYFYAQ